MHPSGKYIYGTDNGLSPSDIEKYDIQNRGEKVLYDSPYHGDYNIGGNLWFSEDGARIFTRGKTVLTVSEFKANDMIYNGTINLQNSNSLIEWLDHSAIKSNLYILSSSVNSNWTRSNNLPYVFVHNSTNLTYKTKLELENFYVYDNKGIPTTYLPDPYFVFSNSTGNNIYVITKATGSSLENKCALEKIKID